ncbi:MAG: O-antigen ligase domain-containing protein, partial [Flavobacteriaceae bacterium]
MIFSIAHKTKLYQLLLHAVIGVVVFVFKPSAIIINMCMIAWFMLFMIKSKDKLYATLVACAYIATSDVFFRMTKGLLFYELHKYLLILFIGMGLLYEPVKAKGKIYIIYIALLLLGIVFTEYNYDEEVRKMIAFNLGGPISLGMVGVYVYKKKIPLNKLVEVLFYMLLPIVSLTVYLFLYAPSVKDVVTGTDSNFTTSGGFGPNQVATILGAGIFIVISRLILSKSRGLLFYVELVLLALIAYRGLVTFSRGGIITGVIATLFFVLLSFIKGKTTLKSKVIRFVILFTTLGLVVWGYA